MTDEIGCNQYQNWATVTMPSEEQLPMAWNLAVRANALASEVGEVCGVIDKHIAQGHPLDREKLVKELGDVMWQFSAMCTASGYNMGYIGASNIQKLRTRYPDGFTTKDSQARIDQQ